MKHGRRHNTLKEQVYSQRFRQKAEGYASSYRPLPLAADEGRREVYEAPEPVDAAALTLGDTLNPRKRKALSRVVRDDEA